MAPYSVARIASIARANVSRVTPSARRRAAWVLTPPDLRPAAPVSGFRRLQALTVACGAGLCRSRVLGVGPLAKKGERERKKTTQKVHRTNNGNRSNAHTPDPADDFDDDLADGWFRRCVRQPRRRSGRRLVGGDDHVASAASPFSFATSSLLAGCRSWRVPRLRRCRTRRC